MHAYLCNRYYGHCPWKTEPSFAGWVRRNVSQFLQYSPNGRYLAYIKDGDIWLYDQQTKESRNLTRTPRARESRPVWSPDGKQFAYIDNYDSHKVHIAAFPPPGGKNTVVKTIYYDEPVELIAW
ncbi:MAG: DPP IV N-terminal domain-containing protein [Bacillota bacterium]